ncbi:MAG: DUF3606 domain-containing protein [Planctomycetota bacterium]
MSDDKSKRGPADAGRVNVKEDYEVKYWCGKFGCTPEQLADAVKAVGILSEDVEKHLLGKAQHV